MAGSSDDAEESASGFVSTTSTDLEMVFDRAGDQIVGMRFNRITIPTGATIVDSYVQFQTDEVSSVDTMLTIEGEATENPVTFNNTNAKLSSRPRTAAAVVWSPAAWPTQNEADPDQRTPNIASVMQEIVNLTGWSAGNSVVIIITGDGERVAEAYDGVADAAPLLHVEYTTQANNPPIVIAGPDQMIAFPARVILDGTVTDDGLPIPSSLTSTWSMVSGPGTVVFNEDNAVDTTAFFSTYGSYVLRLTADDGALTASDEVAIVVNPPAPVAIEVRIGAASDDAEENSSGLVRLNSTDLELVRESDIQTVGMRFNGVAIPQGAMIANAYIQFQTDETDTESTALTIQGQAIDNAPTFTNATDDISSRIKTNTTVDWTPQPWTTIGETGSDQQTPDLASVIQEIVDRPGWMSGNSLAIIITGTGKRVAESYNGDQAGAPLLHVEYISLFVPQVMIDAPMNGAIFNEEDVINFSATAWDIDDGDVTANLSWESSLNGTIGIGGSFARSDLSMGFHTITATVDNSVGLTGFNTAGITVSTGSTAVLVGAGDIARCSHSRDEETAKLLDNIPGTVFTLGDNAYPDGTDQDFIDCYDPTWGRHKARTRPSAGNHDYHVEGALSYFDYFGEAAGEAGKGYYSYDIGDWHIIVLNSECKDIGGCDIDSPQGQWLQSDLEANPRLCTLAYWHKPLFSSDSVHGNIPRMRDFWLILYQNGVDVVLNGHSHVYERFAPQDPFGTADEDYGIRQFIVGTGGAGFYTFGDIQPNSEVRNGSTNGVLKLTLHPTKYDWEFIPVAGQTFTDSGSSPCVP